MQTIKSEEGFTLIEIVVSVALLSGVLACLYYFFIYSVKSNQYIQDQYQAEVSVRNATRTISKQIRKAKAVTIAGSGHHAVEVLDGGMTLNIYTDIDNDNVMELVKYIINGNTLQVGTAELGSSPSGWKTIAEKVGNTALTPTTAAFSISGKQIKINLIIKDSKSSLKDEPVIIETSIAVRSKGAMN